MLIRKRRLQAAAFFAALEGIGCAVAAAVLFDANALGVVAGFGIGAAVLGATTYVTLSLIGREPARA